MTRIKICGLMEVEHARAAAEAGADFVGIVFAEGRRKVTPEKARDVTTAMHTLEESPQVVGVFAGHTTEEVNRIAEYCGLDRVQLSGDEPWSFCLQMTRPVIRTVHIGQATTASQVLALVTEGNHALSGHDNYFHLDTKLGNASGGTGQTFDWRLAVAIARRFPVILTGGQTPENVVEAVRTIQPWGVDVSSGVETGGIKDTKKIIKFIETVRQFDAGAG